jgi:hypothetical protein
VEPQAGLPVERLEEPPEEPQVGRLAEPLEAQLEVPLEAQLEERLEGSGVD